MSGVRGLRPSASYPCVLYNFRLVFNVPGLPYIEPAFASVKRLSNDSSSSGGSSTSTSSTSTSTSGGGSDYDDLSRYDREVHGRAPYWYTSPPPSQLNLIRRCSLCPPSNLSQVKISL